MTYEDTPSDEFGTPSAGDMPARLEADGNSAEVRLRKFAGMMDELIPRALGTKPTSADDEIADYILTAADAPDRQAGYRARAREFREQFGDTRGALEYIRWVQRNERRLEKLGK